MKPVMFRVEHLFLVDGKTVLVFYSSGKCYEFRVLHEDGSIEGNQHIFYTCDAALSAARESLMAS